MKLLGFLNFRRISGQIAALVVISIVALHLFVTAQLSVLHRPDQPDHASDRGHAQLATAIQLLGAAPASERPRLIADIARAFPQLGIAPLVSEPATAVREAEGRHLHFLQRRLGDDYRIFAAPSDGETRKLGIVLPDGAMLSASLLPDQRPRPPFMGSPWMMTLLFAVISVTLLGLWAARALAAPLSSFAKAAESFSLERRHSAASRNGPGGNPLGGEGAQPHGSAISVAVSKPSPNRQPERIHLPGLLDGTGGAAEEAVHEPAGVEVLLELLLVELAVAHAQEDAHDADQHDQVEDADQDQERARDGRADQARGLVEGGVVVGDAAAQPADADGEADREQEDDRSSARARRRSRRSAAAGRRSSACAWCCRWPRCDRRRRHGACRACRP